VLGPELAEGGREAVSSSIKLAASAAGVAETRTLNLEPITV